MTVVQPDGPPDRRSFLRLVGTSTVVGTTSLLAGCGGATDGGDGDGGDGGDNGGPETVGDDDGSPAPDEVQTGGELTVAMQSDVDQTLHPHFIPDTTATTMAENFGNSLVMMTPDGEVVPDLAAEMPEISDDGTSYTFRLREGVTFHPPYDDEMTAADIVENWHAILSDDYGAYGLSTFEGVLAGDGIDPSETVQQTGEYEVTFQLAEPFSPFLTKQAKMSAFGWFTIVPMAAVEEHGEDFGTTNTGVWGTGPFMYNLDESNLGSRYVFEKNPEYFKETEAGQLPYVDRLVFTISPEGSARTSALRAGDIDIDESTPATDIDAVKNADGSNVISKASTAKTSQWVNRRNFEPISKKEVRKALMFAANRQAVVDTKFQGYAEVAHSPLPPWHWAYDEEAAVTYDHDPERASQLLEEAGHGDGFSFKCEPTNQPKFVDVATILQQHYQDVGIDMSVEPASKGATYEPLVGGWEDDGIPPSDWHSMIENFTWGFSADDFTYATFHSGQPFNYSYYENEEADQAMEQARAAIDRDERKEHYATAQEFITDDMPKLFMLWNNVSHGFRDRVKNFQVYPSAYMLFEEVWLDQS